MCVCVRACVQRVPLNLQGPFGLSLQYLLNIFHDCTSSHPLAHASLSLSLSRSDSLSFSSPSSCQIVSFSIGLASVQVLAVVSFRKCAAICWEVRYLPLGQPSFSFFFFFSFCNFIGCLREAELLRAHRTVHSSFVMIACGLMQILADCVDVYLNK